MRGLPRLLGFVALLGVALLLLAPALCGYALQRHINTQEQALRAWLHEHNLQQIQIESSTFQRGWFSSRYAMRIGWQGQEQRFLLNHQIAHGPWSWQRIRRGQWQPQWAQLHSRLDFSRAQWAFVMPELTFDSVIDFAGNVDVAWRFLGYRNQHQQGRLDVASSQGQWHYAKSEKRLYGQWQVPDVRLNLDGQTAGKWTLSGLDIHFDFSRGDSVLPVGELHMALQAARMQQGSHDYRVRGLAQKLQLSEFDRLSNVQWLLTAEHLQSPQWALQNLHWDSILRGISSLGLTVLKPDQPPRSLSALLDGIAAQVVTRTPELLSGTEFELAHVELTTAEGKSQGFLRTQVPALEKVAEMTPADLLKSVDLSAEISVPQAILHRVLADASVRDKFRLSDKYDYLKQRLPQRPLDREPRDQQQWDSLAADAVSQQLRVVLAQGLLHQEQGQYWCQIELKQGKLAFNGNPVHGF